MLEIAERLRDASPLDDVRGIGFKRDGQLIGTPRMTFVTPDASSKDRDTYRRAIDAALDRCTPIPFSNGMGGAIAGRPIAVRFVDNRSKS